MLLLQEPHADAQCTIIASTTQPISVSGPDAIALVTCRPPLPVPHMPSAPAAHAPCESPLEIMMRPQAKWKFGVLQRQAAPKDAHAAASAGPNASVQGLLSKAPELIPSAPGASILKPGIGTPIPSAQRPIIPTACPCLVRHACMHAPPYPGAGAGSA
jgi:hypothetical protein